MYLISKEKDIPTQTDILCINKIISLYRYILEFL